MISDPPTTVFIPIFSPMSTLAKPAPHSGSDENTTAVSELGSLPSAMVSSTRMSAVDTSPIQTSAKSKIGSFR
eukprot:1487185-Rhodomonas_salina.1